MSKRSVAALAVAAVAVVFIQAAAFGPDHLISVDLSRRADFDRAAPLDLEPVFRSGNVFYAVLGGSALTELDRLNIPYRIVETNPLKSGYYYMQATEMNGVTLDLKTGMSALDEADGWRLVKSAMPIMRSADPFGESLYPLDGRTIPLRYVTPMISSVESISDPILDSLVARVTQDSIVSWAQRLQDYYTRYTFSDSNDLAQEWLEAKLASFGYADVGIDTFDVQGWWGHNVICTKPGTIEPDRYIVVGAHYDSYNYDTDPIIYAPGCDDNASGTVGVLEIARALRDIPTRKSIIFVPFDGEEQWMYGSYYFANRAALDGVDIDLMINMDMIGYEPNAFWDVWINTYSSGVAYAEVCAQLAQDYTGVYPYINPTSGPSDQLPFEEAGYRVVYAAEADFNDPNYHRDTDRLTELNPAYWTDVVRMMALMTYVASESPSPVETVDVYDVGDGQALEVEWSAVAGPDITGYRVYSGPASGYYTDTVDVSAGQTSLQLTGLTTGEMCYMAVSAVAATGWESIVRPEISMTPHLYPRTPANVSADPEYYRIDLAWDDAVELDFDHYVVYRGLDSLSVTLYEPFVATPGYSDANVASGITYYYRITSVDHDGYSSIASPVVWAVPATFDRGTLVMDLTKESIADPSEQQQYDVYSAMFSGHQYVYNQYLDYTDPVEKSLIGQYGTVYWIDDDLSWENWPQNHWDILTWFMSYSNNLVIVGWQTPHELESGAMLYDRFRVTDATKISAVDCVGGLGESGFPSVVFDTAKVVDIYTPWNGKLGEIWWMSTADPSAEVIMRYNSAIDDPVRETLPVAVRREDGGAKAVLIGLPLYYMREPDAQDMIAALASWFTISAGPGDVNGSGFVDILDVLKLGDVLFAGAYPPAGYNCADPNGDCLCNVLDLVHLIDYVFRGGTEPAEGCVF